MGKYRSASIYAVKEMSDLSQVFKIDDIFTFWLAISGIIRVKIPNARLLRYKLNLPNPIFHIASAHLTNFRALQIFDLSRNVTNRPVKKSIGLF